jgi:hypothetical protein
MGKKKTTVRPDPVYLPHDPAKTDVVIFDVDGTLAGHGQRHPYDASQYENDPPHAPIIHLAHLLQERYPILVCTGRHEQAVPTTLQWCEKHGVRVHAIFSRRDTDRTPSGQKENDAVVKARIFRDEIHPFYNVHFVVDDRQRVVDMWRWLGLCVLQCGFGDF